MTHRRESPSRPGVVMQAMKTGMIAPSARCAEECRRMASRVLAAEPPPASPGWPAPKAAKGPGQPRARPSVALRMTLGARMALGTASCGRRLRVMLRRRNSVLALLLALLLSAALATPAGPAWASVAAQASLCEGCCATSVENGRCSSVSVCAPASPTTAHDESSPTPQGAWAAGVVRVAPLPVAKSKAWASTPASTSLGPPAYLRFGRFLL